MQKKSETELVVSAIERGTVIDHIPPEAVLKVVSILGLEGLNHQMTIGINLDSRQMGKKGIIKIADKLFTPEEVNRIALVAPRAKLNIIENYNVVEKIAVELPNQISGIVKCMNPKCITNHNDVMTQFEVVSDHPVALRCRYCEKITDQHHFENR